MLASKGTLCLVNEPTHIVGTSSTSLDHVFVRFSKHKSMVNDFKAKVFYYNITDHFILTFSIKFCSAINFDKEKCLKKQSMNSWPLIHQMRLGLMFMREVNCSCL